MIEILKFFEQIVNQLTINNIANAINEAEIIFTLYFNIKRSDIYNTKIYINTYDVNNINKIMIKRCKHIPLQYIYGYTMFFGNKIFVNKNVLIPRQETEILVENAIKYIKPNMKILDLCTGSGCIAISIFKLTQCKVYASDISLEALKIAYKNANYNKCNINFIQSNLFDNINDKFDVIISNPPYIKTNHISTLQEEVKNFEPKIALNGGNDGLYFYRNIIKNINNYLNSGGFVFFECGKDQVEDIIKIINQFNYLNNFKTIDVIQDYCGVNRIIKICRQ